METTLYVPYKKKAKLTLEALSNHYFIPDEGLYLENYEKKADDRDVSYLWPYSGVLSAANALAIIEGEQNRYVPELIKVLENLEQYRDYEVTPVAYDSYIKRQGGGSKFYDDNQWLGLDFIEAYKTLGNAEYLQLAKEMFEFSLQGWDDQLGGGIFWQEDNKKSKNTCSNGPAAVLALRLYEQTGDDYYLQWGMKILDWTKQLQDPNTGVYWDNIRLNGSIDQTTYTYNTGTILHSNALLYKFTGKAEYLEEARNLAEDSVKHFTTMDTDNSIAFFPHSPWFNVILFKGYLALYEVDPDKNMKYIQAIQTNVDYAWTHARDDKGLFSPDWSGKTKVNDQHKWLLDQAPMIEFYALLTRFE